MDATSGRALDDKTPAAVRDLLAKMAQNTHQFGNRLSGPTSTVNEVRTSPMDQQRIETKLEELASMLRQIALGQRQQPLPPTSVCNICSLTTHNTDQCQQL